MYKFRVSNVAPFWARNNENKPNQTIFDNWLNTNMKEVINLPMHFINFTTFTFNGKYNDIKYIEITNTKDVNDVRYYYVDAIELDGGNNTYKYKGVLDVYTSYTLKFINDNLKNEFTFLRQHEYDKRCLQIRDNYLDELPKIYTSYFFKKTLFYKDETNNVWYGNEIGIKDNKDLVNSNKYYVFKDGVNGSYTFYPVLSNSRDVELFYLQRNKKDLKSDLNFFNGRYGSTEKIEISDEVNTSVVNGYRDNDVVEFLYRPVQSNGLRFKDWTVIQNVPYGTLPVDVYARSNQWNQAGAGIKQASFDIYLLGNNVYHYRSGNTLLWDFSAQWNRCKEFIELKVRVYNSVTNWNSQIVKNSLTGLEILRKNETNINKFLGIYYLPHFLNFNSSRLNFQDGYVYFNINPQSDNIGLFKIYEYQLSNITDKINNSSYSTEYFLRYLNIKYYGNNINAEYRTNDQHTIYIGGRMFFTDTANIICKSNSYVSLDNSIINYPYQLPIGVDTYEQYVKANRGVTETGFNIARKNQQLAFAKSITGGVFDYVSGGLSAAANAASGNFMGAASSVLGTAKSMVGMGFDIAQQFQGLANQEAMIRAQYQQANNTMGSDMKFSNIETAALMNYYNDDSGDQYEGVEVSELEENVLILMNNYIYLNGYMLPNTSTFEKKINNDRIFNYIQLDATLLQNQLNISYDESKYNNSIYSMIKEQLLAGIRIWNKIDEKLPEYDDNVEWPDQPEFTRPDIPQPPSPVENVLTIKATKTTSSNNLGLSYGYNTQNAPNINYQYNRLLVIWGYGADKGKIQYNMAMNKDVASSNEVIFNNFDLQGSPSKIIFDCNNIEFNFKETTTYKNLWFLNIYAKEEETNIYENLKKLEIINMVESDKEYIKSLYVRSCVSYYRPSEGKEISDAFKITVTINGEEIVTDE